LTVPTNADFDKLLRTRDALAGDMKGVASVVIPALFTSWLTPASEAGGKATGVAVFDADDLRSIVALLRDGDAERARYASISGSRLGSDTRRIVRRDNVQ
jgi:hypothetical protein